MDAIDTALAGFSAGLTSIRSAFHLGNALAMSSSGQGNEPQWLHTLGQISGVLLMLELCFALLLVCVLAFGIAYAMYWTHTNVTPLLERYSDQARRTLAVVERGSDRVVEGIAEFHGRRQGIEAALRVFFFGPKAAASLLTGRKPLARLRDESALVARPVETFPTTSEELATQDGATTPYSARPTTPNATPPHTRAPRQTPPAWRSLPTGNASKASTREDVARPWRQMGRAGTASGARAGNSRGTPAIGSA